MIVPVILSGGAGTRLWPVSRKMYPKQLLPLVSEKTMLQETALRTEGLDDVVAPLIVCNEDHRFIVAEQLRQIDHAASAILLEPMGRNTAPAIAVAALQAMNDDEDPLLLVLPADHVIADVPAFQAVIRNAAVAAEAGKMVTFGIVPDHPETGYGYIKAGEKVALEQGLNTAYTVERFVEKPNQATAEKYLAEGGYTWNSGMFLFRASRYLEELEKFEPAMVAACRDALQQGRHDLDFFRLNAAAFAASPSNSIDYAVMEKTDDGVVIPLNAGWNDIGSWSALYDVTSKDDRGNATHGDVVLADCTNNFVHAENRLVTAVGLSDCIIVETSDAVLVTTKAQSQDVKKIVDQLKDSDRGEALLHRRVYRPWGSYEGVDASDRFQVKRITVKPGAKLSLQKHFHRAEHWVVVRGTALVTCDEDVRLVTENQSTYLPLGAVHRLENPGKIPLELIEVQSGSYLGEDDIVRLEDTYGREKDKVV